MLNIKKHAYVYLKGITSVDFNWILYRLLLKSKLSILAERNLQV
jgi:hypothetical protein